MRANRYQGFVFPTISVVNGLTGADLSNVYLFGQSLQFRHSGLRLSDYQSVERAIFKRLTMVLASFKKYRLSFASRLTLRLFGDLLLRSRFLAFILRLKGLFARVFLRLFLESRLISYRVSPAVHLLSRLIFARFRAVSLHLIRGRLLCYRLFKRRTVEIAIGALSLILRVWALTFSIQARGYVVSRRPRSFVSCVVLNVRRAEWANGGRCYRGLFRRMLLCGLPVAIPCGA